MDKFAQLRLDGTATLPEEPEGDLERLPLVVTVTGAVFAVAAWQQRIEFFDPRLALRAARRQAMLGGVRRGTVLLQWHIANATTPLILPRDLLNDPFVLPELRNALVPGSFGISIPDDSS